MIQNLVAIIAGGAVTLGIGAGGAFTSSLTDTQKAELIEAKTAAVSSLTAADKELINSYEGKEMRDLTFEEKAELRKIKEKLHDATIAGITDEKLKTEMEENHEKRIAARESRQADRESRQANRTKQNNSNSN